MDWGDALYALFLMGLMAIWIVLGWRYHTSGAARRNRLGSAERIATAS